MKIQRRKFDQSIADALVAQGATPLASRILAARGIQSIADVSPKMNELLPVSSMRHCVEAARHIAQTIKDGKKILVVGDYDCDGATSTAIMMRGLKLFGAQLEYFVPNRLADGYGLQRKMIYKAVERLGYTPALIITVDNGILSFDGIDCANEMGIDVIVTDHHLGGDTLPDAKFIVNPNSGVCNFQSKNIAGCGVAYYVISALFHVSKDFDIQRPQASDVTRLLSIAAIGTVADVVKLDKNNRTIVSAGINFIKQNKSFVGVYALLGVCEVFTKNVVSTVFGFQMAPRINAAGRMDDAGIGIELLTTDKPDLADWLSIKLQNKNLERRAKEAEMREAFDVAYPQDSFNDRSSITLCDKSFHGGVIGILAGRVKEQFHKPTIILAQSSDGSYKGSGRSIQSLHMKHALDAVAAKAPGVLQKFGGHAMAVGMSIAPGMLERFTEVFEEICAKFVPKDSEKTIEHDGGVGSVAEIIQAANMKFDVPFGQGVPEPLFLQNVKIKDQKILKEKHSKFIVEIAGTEINAIQFGSVTPRSGELEAYFTCSMNEWNGNITPQIMIGGFVE